MYRFSSKILISIIVCLSLTINVFASEVTTDEIIVNGIITTKEWGGSSIVLIQGGESTNFEMVEIFVVKDISKSEICIGARVTEKNTLSDSIKNSGIRIVFDEDYILTLWANGEIYESNNNFVKENKAVINISTSNQYSIESRISYPKLCKSMKLKVMLIDVNGNESTGFYIDLDKMLLIQESTIVANDNEANPKSTTREQAKTTKNVTATTEKGTTSKSEMASSKSTSRLNSSKGNIQNTYIYDEDVVNPQAVPLQNNVLVENLEPQQENTNKRKIAGTTVAVALLITAAVLPVMRNIKDKKSEIQNLNENE
ncbi:MAG: hypothetical protein EOM05_06230 [Clostridia bacterium]|nr:hypothetical protein [Clostridia bacterium]